MDWNPDMKSAPTDGRQIEVLLSNGAVCIAEYWEGPPGKEEEWGGWGVCMTQSFCRGTMREDADAEMVSWRPYEGQIETEDYLPA